MAQCPSCGQPIHEDFGLVNCSHCGVAVFVDLDGNVRAQDLEENLSEQVSLSHESVNDFSAPASTGLYDMLVEEAEEVESMDADFVDPVAPLELSVIEDFGATQMGAVDEGSVIAGEMPELPEEAQFANDELNSFDSEQVQPGEAEMDDIEPLEDFSAEENAEVGAELDSNFESALMDPEAAGSGAASAGGGLVQELSDYANSEISQGKDGSLRFNVIVSGIDTPDIRSALEEAMKDRKFIWDVPAIIGSIENGELKIEEMTAVKASVFIKRIKNLPVDIRWEQYAIHQV